MQTQIRRVWRFGLVPLHHQPPVCGRTHARPGDGRTITANFNSINREVAHSARETSGSNGEREAAYGWRSGSPGASEHCWNGAQQNLEVEAERPHIDVLQVELHPLLEGNAVAAHDLPQAGDTRA